METALILEKTHIETQRVIIFHSLFWVIIISMCHVTFANNISPSAVMIMMFTFLSRGLSCQTPPPTFPPPTVQVEFMVLLTMTLTFSSLAEVRRPKPFSHLSFLSVHVRHGASEI